MITRLPTQTNG